MGLVLEKNAEVPHAVGKYKKASHGGVHTVCPGCTRILPVMHSAIIPSTPDTDSRDALVEGGLGCGCGWTEGDVLLKDWG